MTEQTLEDLELAFGSVSDTPARPPSGHSDEVTDRYEQRVDSLVTAEGGKWGAALDGQHTYQSDSEAVMAVIGAMVARHFTNGEIERTLEDSYILSSRVERKGEHGRELIPSEIAKARQKVTPLEEDPGAPSIAARIGRKRHASQAGMDSLNSLNSLFSFGDPCKSWPTLGKDALYGPAGEIVNKIDPCLATIRTAGDDN